MIDPKDLNIELRQEILEIALSIEEILSRLILEYLHIHKPSRKALSNKSGSFSSKNKIDFLYDLEIFDKDEHSAFMLFCEFRNQFVHNLECVSFEKAVEFLGQDKGKRLLKFPNEKTGNLETDYHYSFLILSEKCLDIVADKIQKRIKAQDEIREYFSTMFQQSQMLIDLHFTFYTFLLKNFEHYISAYPEDGKKLKPLVKKIILQRRKFEKELAEIVSKRNMSLSDSALMTLFFGRDMADPDGMDEPLRTLREILESP